MQSIVDVRNARRVNEAARTGPSNVLSYFVLASILLAIQLYGRVGVAAITPPVFMSQLLLLGVILLHLGLNLFGRQPSFPDSSILVFEILFLVIAPSLQTVYDARFMVNTQPLDETYALQCNLIYIVFILFYLGGRYLIPFSHPKAAPSSLPAMKINYVALIVVLAICAVATASAIGFARHFQAGDFERVDITPVDMVERKLLYFLIVPVFVLIVLYRPRRIGPIWILMALAAFAMLFFCQNPAIEKRNALGPIYLMLLSLMFWRWLKTPPRVFWSIFILSGLFFPISEIFTHHKMDEWAVSPGMFQNFFVEHFTSTAYDAWANTISVAEMVSREGVSWGKQLAGALLFFVPHSIWPGKPQATGIVIGEYLSRNYRMWFLNLSAPLPAEGYLDFAWAGVVAYGVILGRFSRRIDALIASSPMRRALGFYLSFYMIFLLRGSLMVAVAYVTPVFATFLLVDFFLLSRKSQSAGVGRRPALRDPIA